MPVGDAVEEGRTGGLKAVEERVDAVELATSSPEVLHTRRPDSAHGEQCLWAD